MREKDGFIVSDFQPQVQDSNYGTEKETGWTWLSGMVVAVAVTSTFSDV